MTPKEVMALCREKDVKAVDVRFLDLPGLWQHVTLPVGKLTEGVFEEGIGCNGASLPGWQGIYEGDILVVPQSETAFLDPFAELPTLAILGNIQDPITREDHAYDPRNIARKAANYLRRSGIADTAFFGPEAEFYVFDEVRYEQSAHQSYFFLAGADGERRRAHHQRPHRATRWADTGGETPPVVASDQLIDLRSEMMQTMIDCDLDVDCQRHEVGTAGKSEIDLRYQEIVKMADSLLLYKYIAKRVAKRRHKTVTFMPKPVWGESGSGMHTHVSLWKEGSPLFAGSGYAGLSDIGLHAIGGILRHAPALLAFTNPTTNSYKRLVPGGNAPIYLTYSQRVRSAACRIPMYSPSPRSKRIEFRCPDPSCNPYLAFAAVLMAVIDGIQNKIRPGEPLEKPIDELAIDEASALARTPASLEAALDALQADSEFLLRDDVFSPDVIRTWIRGKRTQEVDALQRRPHPYEFCLYYDV
jgi:glutamine synthetase